MDVSMGQAPSDIADVLEDEDVGLMNRFGVSGWSGCWKAGINEISCG